MANTGKVRIIAGRWRGRTITFPDHTGLRPTPGRVRETLFNWLAPSLHGARCLDMFAGSGALGLEALSRGAFSCDFVECANEPVQALNAQLRQLGGESQAAVYQADALQWCQDQHYDIVFVDPPFAAHLCEGAIKHLLRNAMVARGSQIYLEQSALAPPSSTEPLAVLKDKQAGDVRYRLLEVD